MKLLLKQRMFSWFDSYDIYDDSGVHQYSVKGKLAWGHELHIYDTFGNEVGYIKQKMLRMFPTFEIYSGYQCIGKIEQEFSFFRPKYYVDCKDYSVTGDFFMMDYKVHNRYGDMVAYISKQFFRLTDTYVIECYNNEDVIYALLITLAIDAANCSHNS